jgi:apolipoprotein N-acyltransferase
MSLLLRVALTALSAIATGLAFPPASLKLLIWVALAPWLAVLHGASLRSALLLGWGWTLLAAWIVGSWMPDAVANYFLQPRALGYAFFFGVATGMAALFYMAFAAAYRALAGRLDPRWLPWAAGAAWCTAEFGRGRLLTALAFVADPWGLLGYSQVGFDPVVQAAAATGIYGIGFAIAAANAGLAELALAACGRGSAAARRRVAEGALLGVLPALVALLYGHLVLRAAPEVGAAPDADAVAAVIVQGNVSLGTRWRSEFHGRNLDVYLEATQAALSEHPGGVVFWPEAAFTFLLEDEPDYARAIARVLQAGDGELVAGGVRNGGSKEEPRYFNTIFALDPTGRILERYDKQYLVPFTEYFPLRRIDLLRRNFERVRFFEHGGPARLLPTRAGRAGILTCNEVMLPELAASRVRAGAELLVNPSNDTWIPDRRFADHLFDIASVRAIEQRRFLVRASTSGPSAIVDPWGRVQARSQPFTRAVVRGWIAARTEETPYARVGDLFACVCAAVLPLALWRARRRPTSASP